MTLTWQVQTCNVCNLIMLVIIFAHIVYADSYYWLFFMVYLRLKSQIQSQKIYNQFRL